MILSARSDLPTKLRGFELGASDYVAKPFALDELIARVRAQLRQRGRHLDDNVVRAGRARARPRTPAGADRRRSSPTSRTASSGCSTTSSSTRAR